MNLQKLNLIELHAQEMRETDGGMIPILIGIAIILTATNWGNAFGCAAAKPVYERR